MEVIIDAKERQAAEANKNATILLQEIDQEKVRGGYSVYVCVCVCVCVYQSILVKLDIICCDVELI